MGEIRGLPEQRFRFFDDRLTTHPLDLIRGIILDRLLGGGVCEFQFLIGRRK